MTSSAPSATEIKPGSRPACPSCDDGEPSFFLEERDRQGVVPHRSFRLVRCEGCGLVYMHPRPSEAAIRTFYPKDYWWEMNLSRLRDRLVLKAREALWWDILRLVRSQAPKGGELLDVGCGSGVFLRLTHKAGFQTLGTEQSQETARRIQEQFRLDVEVGGIERFNGRRRFDVITLFHVLEHVGDPAQTLRVLRDLLKPDGRLVIEVPNIRSWGFKIFKGRWAGLDLPRHLTHFSPRSLRCLLERSGFRLIQQRSFTWRNSPSLWASSIFPSLLPKAKAGFGGSPFSSSLRLFLQAGGCLLCAPLSILEAFCGSGEVLLVVAGKEEST